MLCAIVIDIIGPDTTQPWSTVEDASLIASFLPTDAAHVRDAPGSGKLGPDHIYLSQALAASLVASMFTNSAEQPVVPGTFDWQCATTEEVCEIGVGTNS